MTNTTWIECPACEIGYRTQAEADQCRTEDLANGMIQLPNGDYAQWVDHWDPSEENNIESI